MIYEMANPITISTQKSRSSAKSRKLTYRHQEQPLITGLPDHIAQLCLSRIHPSLLFSVCHSWRRLIYSPSFPPFLSLYVLFSSNIDDDQCHSNLIQLLTFDPISSNWDPLPPLPPSDPPLHLLLHHPSFISRNLPIQSISVSGNLILLAATTHNLRPALSRPLIFNPISRSWCFGPTLVTPRRWCVAGASGDVVYVASGIGSHFSTDVSKSVEKWDLQKMQMLPNTKANSKKKESIWKWEKMKGLKDGKFSRDAIDAVGWRGKLYMVNMKGDAAKEGIVYDVEKDEWEGMPEGMVSGWKGYVAAMDEEVMYMVVDQGNRGMGLLRRYDEERDDWEDIIMESELLRGAQQIAAAGGRVCVVTAAGGIIAVDVVAVPPRLWVVQAPPGFQPLALHILPRMSQPDFHIPGVSLNGSLLKRKFVGSSYSKVAEMWPINNLWTTSYNIMILSWKMRN